ncbi:MAG TPA: PEP-CTERM sorting domain-containing protein [Tepidisphaeraceae bacterium]|jgi:hypothetical protein|nr:PEP-CTERM sorting domain-containing protein [Tepidisphaeraceae bacterium]
MSAHPGTRGIVCAAHRRILATAISAPASAIAATMLCLGFVSVAHGALEKELHEVNTSVGLLPTSATNVWKLETDPVLSIQNSPDSLTSGFDLSTAIPIEGMLDASFDPTKFQLALDPGNEFALGYSVQGLGAYSVTGFEVLLSTGGYVDVQETNGNPLEDTVMDVGDTQGGVETGVVDDIHFVLQSSLKNLALLATQDQLFYQLNLVAIGGGPGFDPGIGMTFAGPDSFLTVEDANGNMDTTTNDPDGGQYIYSSSTVPEPATIGLLGLASAGLLRRRQK